VTDIEIVLATNGTAQGLQEVLAAACEKRYSKPADIAQCFTVAGALQLPASIDFLLTNFPPLILCQELKICPL